MGCLAFRARRWSGSPRKESSNASIGGLGGCPFAPGAAGNVATEDLVYMLSEMGIETGIDLERLLDVTDLVAQLVGRPVRARINRSLLQ